jgi:hypothetical protein
MLQVARLQPLCKTHGEVVRLRQGRLILAEIAAVVSLSEDRMPQLCARLIVWQAQCAAECAASTKEIAYMANRKKGR